MKDKDKEMSERVYIVLTPEQAEKLESILLANKNSDDFRAILRTLQIAKEKLRQRKFYNQYR